MRLSGGGRELEVPGKNVRVSASIQFERKDLSGGSSDSSFANEGAKPQKLSVSCQIPTDEAAELAALLEVARACDANDNPIVYTISDDLSAALGSRQVIFAGQFSASESDSLRVYDVSFELQEYQTVAQKREERANENAASVAPAQDGVVQVGSVNPEKVNAIVKETAK